MLRKLCKLVMLPALLGMGFATGTALGQSQPSVLATASAPNVAPQAAMWAATADYVYHDDQSLVKILPQLLKTIKSNSVSAFSHGIDEAVVLENKQTPSQNHLLKFQELFKTIQAQAIAPNDPAALVQAIVARLDDNKERMANPTRAQQLMLLSQHLNQLAASTTPTVPATSATPSPTSAADNPIDQLGAAPAAVAAPVVTNVAVPASDVLAAPPSWVFWLALALSILSLMSIAVLWNKLNNTRVEVVKANKRIMEAISPKSSGDTFSPAKLTAAVEQEVSRQREKWLADQQAQTTAPEPAPLAPLEASVQLAVAAPTVRMRTQYVSEAPFNNSFLARSLSDQPGTYSMFAIESSEQQPDQGTFTVTGNLASHVRDHRTVLKPVCEYINDNNPLGSETRVVTEHPGQVRRRGADWEVTQRAKVRFE